MNPSCNPRRAFTLIETVIIIAFSVSVMIALVLLMYIFTKSSTYEQAIATSSGSATLVMREIELYTLPADAFVLSHTFPGAATYTSTTTSLVLELPSIDSSGYVIANTYDYVAFYATGTMAYRIIDKNALSNRATGTKALSSNISSFTFTYNNSVIPNATTTTVDVQTQTTVRQQTYTDHRREQIRLRNY